MDEKPIAHKQKAENCGLWNQGITLGKLVAAVADFDYDADENE
jgi:hypothetical protein